MELNDDASRESILRWRQRAVECPPEVLESMSVTPGDNRPGQHLEDLWRLKLKIAEDRHKATIDKFNRAAEDQRLGLTLHPDGFHAISNALKEETAAQHEYMRVSIFTELVVNHKLPPDE